MLRGADSIATENTLHPFSALLPMLMTEDGPGLFCVFTSTYKVRWDEGTTTTDPDLISTLKF